MVRKLKFHEQKLLRKTDFITWEIDQKNKQAEMMQKYHVTKREHYAVYNRLANDVRTIANKLKDLPQGESFRQEKTKELLGKLYTLGIIATADTLEKASNISGSSFARRRLPVCMKRSEMVPSVRQASDFVEQGHIRVGPKLAMDPAFMVTRAQEDMITWCRASKIREQVLEYNEALDDFDLA
ncbi:unnamed protein product, partial [Mesorhabditis belari]|uniref:U3 small nucleolar ribonucleoprotein IMP3 n=1 Tax=Mesorhabditis belari TaxID=2138241 RepID=A0AAF3EY77_9BILA